MSNFKISLDDRAKGVLWISFDSEDETARMAEACDRHCIHYIRSNNTGNLGITYPDGTARSLSHVDFVESVKEFFSYGVTGPFRILGAIQCIQRVQSIEIACSVSEEERLISEWLHLGHKENVLEAAI